LWNEQRLSSLGFDMYFYNEYHHSKRLALQQNSVTLVRTNCDFDFHVFKSQIFHLGSSEARPVIRAVF
jgi:uncharacterized protein (DUF924 family)